MLIVKPYGRSVSKANEKTSKLKENSADLASDDLQEFPRFNSSDPRILIGQWISMIDKIIKKPNLGDVDKNTHNVRKRQNKPTDFDLLRKAQIEARTELANAAWHNLESMLPKEEIEHWKKVWDRKIHPAGNDYTKLKNERFNPKGRWFFAFLRTRKEQGKTQSPDDLSAELQAIDHTNLANDLYAHLHQRERRRDGNTHTFTKKEPDGQYKPYDMGLVESRAKSVSNNALTGRMSRKLTETDMRRLVSETRQPGWSAEDEKLLKNKGDLAKQIHDKCVAAETDNGRLQARDAADIVFKHYGEQFGKKTRAEIRESDPDLLNLYDAVRTYYRTFLKTTGKGRSGKGPKGPESKTSKISKILPKNNEALFALLGKRHDNALVNDLIRFGRVLHYMSTGDDQDGFALGENDPIWTMTLDDIALSQYWSSDGQSDIKRTEAFVRVWRNSISQAQRTASAFADPQGNAEDIDKDGKPRKGDILGEHVGRAQSEKPKIQNHATEHAKLLFGEQAKLFAGEESAVTIEDFIFASLRLLAKLRNEGFHFKGRRGFVNKLKNSFKDGGAHKSAEMKTAIKTLLKKDREDHRNRLLDVCEGARINAFTDKDEFEKFVLLAEQSDQSDFVLPRFNLILGQMDNIAKNDKSLRTFLPVPANSLDMKNEANLARFRALKLLYERPFKNCLEQLPYESQLGFVRAAKERQTAAAKQINRNDPYNDQIEGKTSVLPDPSKSVSFVEYMNALTAYQATEMRVQKGYESDPEAAREQMAWIEKFRREVIGHAFVRFVNGHKSAAKLHWLVDLRENTSMQQRPAPRPELKNSQAGEAQVNEAQASKADETWLAVIYYILHFIPVDDISRLLHQFRKWGALEKKGGGDHKDANVDALKKILVLYLEMHDDKHTGEGISLGLDRFKGYFEKEGDFVRVFVTEGSTDQQLVSTRRGLREIMRYGHFEVLSNAIGNSKITPTEVDKLLKYEAVPRGKPADMSPIARVQTKRITLHRKITTQKYCDENDVAEYAKMLRYIQKHRRLANHVRLNNHVRLHQLMMRVVGRLVDYAGLWERDGYFIALALMKLHQKKPNDVFKTKNTKDYFRRQGHLPRYPATQIEPGFYALLQRFHRQSEKDRTTRNDIDHFNILAGENVDLTDAINRVRSLMAYDRKLKNAVSKSIIDLLHREGIELQWQMETTNSASPNWKRAPSTTCKNCRRDCAMAMC